MRPVLVSILLWVAGTVWNYRAFSWDRVIEVEYTPRYVSLPKPEIVKVGALGFAAVLADLYWVGASHYFGEPRYKSLNYSQLHEYIDIINALAPDFHEPYAFAGAAIPWNTGTEWVNVDEANTILRRGIERFPEDWRLHFFLGYNLGTYQRDWKGAGLQMELAAKCTGAPPYLLTLSARYLVEGQDLEGAKGLAEAMVETAGDEHSHDVFLHHLHEIEAEQEVLYFEGSLATYKQAHDGRPPNNPDDLGLQRPFATYRDPVGDPYLYDPATGTFRSATLERFRPYGLEKKP